MFGLKGLGVFLRIVYFLLVFFEIILVFIQAKPHVICNMLLLMLGLTFEVILCLWFLFYFSSVWLLVEKAEQAICTCNGFFRTTQEKYNAPMIIGFCWIFKYNCFVPKETQNFLFLLFISSKILYFPNSHLYFSDLFWYW